jgi:hypothetical protein
MATINELTVDDFRRLLDEYFAPPEKRTKMTDEEIKDLAVRLNEKINIPFIREINEQKIYIKVIVTIDRFLYDNLPNELYDLIRSLDEGISDDEAKRLIKRVSTLANEKINIPYISEEIEYMVLKFVIGIIINSARKGWDLVRAKTGFENIDLEKLKKDADTDSLVLT